MALGYDVIASHGLALPQDKDGGKALFCVLSCLLSVVGSALEPAWGGYHKLDKIGQYHIDGHETESDAGLFCIGPVFFALRGNEIGVYSGRKRKVCHGPDRRCAA